MSQIPFGEAAIIAVYKRMLELGKTPRKELEDNAKRIIEKYNLSEEDVQSIYEDFCDPDFDKSKFGGE